MRRKRIEGQSSFDFYSEPRPHSAPPKKPPKRVSGWRNPPEWRKNLDLPDGQVDSIDDAVQRRFNVFHPNNPRVYELLVSIARQEKAKGKRNYSIWALFNRVRWHIQVETNSEEPFKLSNDFTGRYSRLIMKQEPDLKGFFKLRPLGPRRRRAV